ncbi:MAG: hypothetical protein AB1441_07580 [Bacillota bacterium]
MIKHRGAGILIQLRHAGPRAPARANAGRQPVVPSGVPFVLEEPPSALTPEEIDGIIKADFLAAALRAKNAGFDGVNKHSY